jgi:hypothetical protein
MPLRRRPSTPPVDPAASFGRGGVNGGRSISGADWTSLLRRIERKRRALARAGADTPPGLPANYYVRATYASFILDGLDVTPDETRDAIEPAPNPTDRPLLRSRQALRMRNHAAILHHVENDLREGLPLTTDGVVRWYVAISAGLSTTGLDHATTRRLEEVVRRVNSPQMRLQAALHEVATAHVRLLADPLVPSFNGILARLLLRYHLGRCKLPAVLFDPALDARTANTDATVRRLVELLEQSYDELLTRKR